LEKIMLSEQLAGPERGQNQFLSQRETNENLDCALDDNIDGIAAIALVEQRLAGFERKLLGDAG
jgi:hypothetical protein